MLQRLRSIGSKDRIWRDLSLVAGGTAAGQVLSVLAAPALSRLYLPASFGTLAVYTSMTAVVASVSSLSYQTAIPVPREDGEAARLTVLALICVLGTSLLAALCVFLFGDAIAALVPTVDIKPYLVFVPLGILGLSSYEVLTQWAARKKVFAIIARTSVTRSFIQVGVQVLSGAFRLGSIGLVGGQLLGQWSGTFNIGRKAWRAEKQELIGLRFDGLKAAAVKHKRFPLITGPGTLINALDSNSAPLLFAHFFGATVTGYFALGQRLLSIPFIMVSSSAQKVFFPIAATAHHNGTLVQETDRMFRRLAMIASPLVFLLSSAAPAVFAVVLGARWREAGTYLQWLSVRTSFTLIVFPLMPLMYVLGRQGLGTLFNVAQLVVRIGAICIGSLRHDPHLAVALLGTGTGILWVGYLFYLLSLNGNTVFSTFKVLAKEAVVGAAITAPVLALKYLHAGDLPVAAAAAAAALGAAWLIVRRMEAEGPITRPHEGTETG